MGENVDEANLDSDAVKPIVLWKAEIEAYEEEIDKWDTQGKKIVARFKDERNARQKSAGRYNILWSNVQTLAPAVYSNPPKPNIERRLKSDDDVGRVASEVLEKAVSYFTSDEKFDTVMKQAVQDRLLPGRGTAWVRYVPKFKPVEENEQITDDEEVDADVEPKEELDYEEVCVDYVYWQDFGHTVARTWEDCRGVWRRVYLSRTELITRFGQEIGKKVPLDYEPKKLNDEKMKEVINKATIYEIWDKSKKMAYWLSKHHSDMLDEVDDPLKLKEFFPCPKPIYATLTTDSLIPTPDYYMYQDQADELDELTARIQAITKSVKVAGVYDASAQGVNRLLSEGVENTLIPVEKWAMFGEKGGLKGAMELLPMVDIVTTLQALYEVRDQVKKDLNEITGISDIIRGASEAGETATAQRIKGQYASMRLDTMQKDAARFGRDLVAIIAEIIAEQFSLDTIKQISGVHLLSNMEKQQIQMQQSAPGQPPPLPEAMQDLLDAPSWEDVEALLRNQQIRCYRIAIETDSTIKADQEADRASTNEFLESAGGFIKEAMGVENPDIQALLIDMLMMGVRHNKAGRELEGQFEEVAQKLKKAAANPQPKPDPEMEKIKADAVARQQEQQQQAQIEEQRNKMEDARAQQQLVNENELEKTKQDNAMKMALLEHELKIREMQAQTTQSYADAGIVDPTPIVDNILKQLGGFADTMHQATQAHVAATIAHSKPKIITLDNGRTARVEPING